MTRKTGIKSTIMWSQFMANTFAVDCCACTSTRRRRLSSVGVGDPDSDKDSSNNLLSHYNNNNEDDDNNSFLLLKKKPQHKFHSKGNGDGARRSSSSVAVRAKKMVEGQQLQENRVMDSSIKMTMEEQKSSSRFVFTVVAVISAVLIHFLTPVLFPRPTPIISMNDGQVQGRVAYSRDGREFWQFLSIPYAQAPVGKLRFTPPVPVEPWDGVKQTSWYPPFCVQFDGVITQRVFGEEDCLFLNVFAQPFKNGSSSLKPVFIHIHGGGFLEGGSRIYGPDYLMDHDMVVVTFNYRLGPFGFLNFEHDPSVDNVDLPRGNMGMKDQLLVLKWVQNNIAHFGGDPNSVTVYGESAGSISTHLHVLSPKSKGLFHRAISQSGSAFCSWGFTTQPRQVAYSFAKQLNCPSDNSSVLLDCLQNYDPWEMVRYQVSVTDPTLLKDNLSPSVESVLRDDTFLHQHPTQILEGGNFSQVPYMLGVNSADGALRTGRFDALPYAVPALKSNWTQMIGNVLLLDQFPASVADRVRDFYYGSDEDFDKTDRQSFLDTLTVLFTDVFASEPIQRAAKAHARDGAPTYLYYYDYMPRVIPGFHSVYKAFNPDNWVPSEIQVGWTIFMDWVDEHLFGGKGAHQYGVVHGEENYLLWNLMGASKWVTWWDLEFSQSFVKALADFAKGTNDVKFKEVVWPHITIPSGRGNDSGSCVIPYMHLQNSGEGKVIPEPFQSRVSFWNSIGISTFN